MLLSTAINLYCPDVDWLATYVPIHAACCPRTAMDWFFIYDVFKHKVSDSVHLNNTSNHVLVTWSFKQERHHQPHIKRGLSYIRPFLGKQPHTPNDHTNIKTSALSIMEEPFKPCLRKTEIIWFLKITIHENVKHNGVSVKTNHTQITSLASSWPIQILWLLYCVWIEASVEDEYSSSQYKGWLTSYYISIHGLFLCNPLFQ